MAHARCKETVPRHLARIRCPTVRICARQWVLYSCRGGGCSAERVVIHHGCGRKTQSGSASFGSARTPPAGTARIVGELLYGKHCGNTGAVERTSQTAAAYRCLERVACPPSGEQPARVLQRAPSTAWNKYARAVPSTTPPPDTTSRLPPPPPPACHGGRPTPPPADDAREPRGA